MRDETVVNSSFEVVSELIKQKRSACCHFIDMNKTITFHLKENLKSYYNKYTVECRDSCFVIKGSGFEISVYVYSESNVKAIKKVKELIPHDAVGLVYADPIGPVNNSEKCLNCFDEFKEMDLLTHYSEVNKDRIFHRDVSCRTMNDLERETTKKYKFTTGIISRAAQKYAFFYATNTDYEVIE